MGKQRDLSSIKSIVIHCAATPDGKHFTAEQIDKWHHARGFARDMSIAPNHAPTLQHIGYHYVIELDGTVRDGRPLQETGAHVADFNINSIGICLVGTSKFTHSQWFTLLRLIQTIEESLNTSLELLGHNQLSKKDCPNFDVPEWQARKFRPLPENVLESDDELV